MRGALVIVSGVWAWAIQNWIPLLGGLLVVVWAGLEILLHQQESSDKSLFGKDKEE